MASPVNIATVSSVGAVTRSLLSKRILGLSGFGTKSRPIVGRCRPIHTYRRQIGQGSQAFLFRTNAFSMARSWDSRRCMHSTSRLYMEADTGEIKYPPVCFSQLPVLEEPYLENFKKFFSEKKPCLIPPSAISPPPSCLQDWVTSSDSLNLPYFEQFEDSSKSMTLGDAQVEVYHPHLGGEQLPMPLIAFLAYLTAPAAVTDTMPSLYLAQHQIPSLLLPSVQPPSLTKVDKGDIYSTTMWAGHPGNCRTPLHWDPNPNIFLQLAGKKRFRLLPADAVTGEVGMRSLSSDEGPIGRWIWGRSWGKGEEGFESEESRTEAIGGWEVELGPGQAVFLPRGVWHIVRGVGEGVCLSVNWWFR